jgi:hypothetical protein
LLPKDKDFIKEVQKLEGMTEFNNMNLEGLNLFGLTMDGE